MCLDALIELFEPCDPAERVAWKVGAIVRGQFYTEFDQCCYAFNDPSKKDEIWHTAQVSTS